MFNEKPKNNFKIYNLEDKQWYFYDITNYIKYIMGDFVERAEIHLGYIFNEDTENEKNKELIHFTDICCKIDKDYERTKRIPIHNNAITRITFTNGKRIEVSAMDYGYIIES